MGSGGSAPLGGSGGAGKSGGAGVTGGSTTGGNAAGGSASGGASNGGSVPGGAGSGGAGSGGAGSGGSANGGAGSGGGASTAAAPSPGCEKGGGRPAGGTVTKSNEYYFAFPESYDGAAPLPVLFAFHGCSSGNRGTSIDNTEWMNLTRNSDLASSYVRAVPISSDTGGCWTYNADISRVKAAYDDLVAGYCVDTARVFATGHSSGAQFIVQLLQSSHQADAQHLDFRGVAPVAASDYGALTGPIPVMYIQGQMDAERGNGDGHETVERFRAANACGDTSMPYSEVMGCQSSGTSVDPGCVSYTGCTAPTVWCSHNDPQYGGTMHGVPCFGVQAMFDFFESLP